jgi:uncharacterized membrane protein (Fun14 family)
METKTLDEQEILDIINSKRHENSQLVNTKVEEFTIQSFEDYIKNVKPSDVIETIRSNQIVQILSSFGTGYSCGSIGKKIGARLATVVGSAALSIVLLNHLGYVQINQEKINQDIQPIMKSQNAIQDTFTRFKKFVQDNIFVSIAFGFGVILS